MERLRGSAFNAPIGGSAAAVTFQAVPWITKSLSSLSRDKSSTSFTLHEPALFFQLIQ
jgi:hypothetical protein